jgi:hypothetical protein
VPGLALDVVCQGIAKCSVYLSLDQRDTRIA